MGVFPAPKLSKTIAFRFLAWVIAETTCSLIPGNILRMAIFGIQFCVCVL
jgi:hypothetical protein